LEGFAFLPFIFLYGPFAPFPKKKYLNKTKEVKTNDAKAAPFDRVAVGYLPMAGPRRSAAKGFPQFSYRCNLLFLFHETEKP